ncbi:hypothetical protein TFLX_00354 [Thermoflexales bacterium]|nr:hypothetical protein TFLX_00354 [Thermoflexales bacterium]
MQGSVILAFSIIMALWRPVNLIGDRPAPDLSRPALSPAATTYYVDGQIAQASCTTYNVATRSCGSGAQTAYSTLTSAANVAQPGDLILIRQGTYNQQLNPQHSGTAGNPITYRNYASEVVVIVGSFSPASIILNQVSYITIEGLHVEDSRWLEATNAHFNVIRNNVFLHTPASGTTGNVRFISSDHNQVVGNVLEDGNDNLLLIDSDYNLVEGNTLREGRHSLLSIRCSNYNLIRNNYFANTQQKIAEVYDCGEDTTAVPHAFNATQHNVIEHNVFADANTYYSTSGGNGIQYAGQDGVIRYNVFYHTNVGLGMQIYSDEALYNQRNRVYHNVFYDNDCAGIAVRGDALNNVYKNNILFKNKGLSGDCFGVGPAQVVYRTPLAEFFFERNDILNHVPGEAVIHQEFGNGDTLAYFESHYPALFAHNLQVLPAFRDEAAYDFRLQSSSPLINAGAFLARATTSGSGTLLPVDDARYFRDNYAIAGVSGDRVQLAGQSETAAIVGIDYTANTLTLDRALSWSANQGVSLAYEGSAPDVGAYEFTPELVLYGSPADRTLHLNWTIDSTLPPTSTWRIAYYSQTVPSALNDIVSPTRAYTLTGLTNYAWYTVTLNAMLNMTPLYTATLKLMPTDRLVYLPIVLR